MLNSHKVFFNTDRSDFLKAIDVPDQVRQKLMDARDLIRAEIRHGFRSWQNFEKREVVIERMALRKLAPDPQLKPKFRMQGSATYATLNHPAHLPPQQIDFDDGVYLPVSFLAETGSPVVASTGYFKLVETILEPLCQREGWTLVTDKPSCVRVELDDTAHLDLPLYAIPDREFQALMETAMKSAFARAGLGDNIDLDENVYAQIPRNEIRLAHRTDRWIKSDPRLIEDWFKDAVETHGQQLRRICRYLKAWRDYHWKNCSLSSITLMKCVVDAYDAQVSALDEKRDDKALSEIATLLPSYFQSVIDNPVLEGALNDNWTPDQRKEYVQLANELADGMFSALQGAGGAVQTLSTLTRLFGNRIPQKVELIESVIEARVRAYGATRVIAPDVPRTTSG